MSPSCLLTAELNYKIQMSRLLRNPWNNDYNVRCHGSEVHGNTTIGKVITIWRQVGEALVLAPLPLSIAHIEVNLHGTGYSLILVWWDLHNNSALKYKYRNTIT